MYEALSSGYNFGTSGLSHKLRSSWREWPPDVDSTCSYHPVPGIPKDVSRTFFKGTFTSLWSWDVYKPNTGISYGSQIQDLG